MTIINMVGGSSGTSGMGYGVSVIGKIIYCIPYVELSVSVANPTGDFYIGNIPIEGNPELTKVSTVTPDGWGFNTEGVVKDSLASTAYNINTYNKLRADVSAINSARLVYYYGSSVAEYIPASNYTLSGDWCCVTFDGYSQTTKKYSMYQLTTDGEDIERIPFTLTYNEGTYSFNGNLPTTVLKWNTSISKVLLFPVDVTFTTT